MHKFLLTLALSFSTFALFAQMPNKGSGGNNNEKGMDFDFKKSGFAVVTGSLRDAVTKEPIEYASVSLIRTRDSAAQCGMFTSSNGKFRFEELPVGNYVLFVSYIGYKKYRGEQFVINNSTYKIDLGTVDVLPSSTSLGEVEVEGNQATFEMHADKKVFNVDKNLTTVGGTASDVLKNVPSVTVDQDGNVSLRGKSNVTILINNKPSNFGSDLATVLQQIPANTIENIEVITNPSAKYSAESVAGIINIVLKKNKLEGYNGVLIAGLGSNSALNRITDQNATGTFNFRTEKLSVATTYSFRNDINRGWGMNRMDTLGRRIYRQLDTSVNRSTMHFGGITADYNINAFNTVGLSLNMFRMVNPISLTNRNYDYGKTAENTEIYTSNRVLEPENDNYMRNFSPGFTYRHVFVNPKHTLDLDVSVGDFRRYANSIATDNYIPLNMQTSERNGSDARARMYNAQADYVLPIESYKLEAGYKMNIFDLDLENTVTFRPSVSSEYTRDPKRSSVTHTRTTENAVYATFSGKYRRLDYQTGLRGEYVEKDISIEKNNSADDSIRFSKSYPDLFPSLYLTYNMKENRSMGLNYSRRVTRPHFMQIIPYTDYSIPKQLRKGNPDLEPEFTHSMEFNYSKVWDNNSLNFTLYDYYTTNAVTYFREQLGKDTTITTFKNTSTSNDYGIELVVKNQLYKWWDITTSINAYHNQLNGENLGLGTKSSFAGDVHIVSAFRPRWAWSKNTSMQLTAYYQTEQTLIQGYIEPSLSFDLGLKKEWGKKKEYSLNVSLNDIFNQRKFTIHSRSGEYDLLTERRFESRTISLTFMYRYGKMDAAFLKKKKNTGPNMMGGDGF